MKTKNLLLLFLLVNFAPTSFAQNLLTDEKNDSAKSRDKVDPMPVNPSTILSDFNWSNYELFSSNLSFNDQDAAALKVGFAPFKLANSIDTLHPGLQVMKEGTRFSFAQGKSTWTIGAGIGYDNTSGNSARSRRIARETCDSVLTSYGNTVSQANFRRTDLVQQRNDSVESITARYQASPAKRDSLLKIVTARYNAQIKTLTTEIDSISKIYNERLKRSWAEYNRRRMDNTFKWTLGYNAKFFNTMQARQTSPTEERDTTNYYSLKTHAVTTAFGISAGEGMLSVNFSYSVLFNRASAAIRQPLLTYNSASFNFRFRVWNIVGESKLPTFKPYVDDHFIPSIYAGASYENLFTKGNAFYIEDGIKTKHVLTFFCDVAVKSSVQFRVGVPITWTRKVDNKTGSNLGGVLQVSFSLADL